MIDVLIVDDDAMLRDCLKPVIESEPNVGAVRLAADALEAYASMEARPADLVLMDIVLPRISGIDAMREIGRRFPGTRLLAFSGYHRLEDVRNAFSAGAHGFALKSQGVQGLLAGFRKVRRGEEYVSVGFDEQALGRMLRNVMRDESTSAFDLLTQRQREVLLLVVEGKTSAQIAEHLSLSKKTVEKYRTDIRKKVGINSVSGLTKYAIQQGLIPPP